LNRFLNSINLLNRFTRSDIIEPALIVAEFLNLFFEALAVIAIAKKPSQHLVPRNEHEISDRWFVANEVLLLCKDTIEYGEDTDDLDDMFRL
jgi:hypothetical protein